MAMVLLVLQMILAIALIAVVLIQRTAQDGGGLTGGGSTMGGLFTARGSANLLTRTTAILATLFILNSLALGYLAAFAHRSDNPLDQVEARPGRPMPPVPGAPAGVAPDADRSVPVPPVAGKVSAPPPRFAPPVQPGAGAPGLGAGAPSPVPHAPDVRPPDVPRGQ
jgi:preprotein translocase subunit SecG